MSKIIFEISDCKKELMLEWINSKKNFTYNEFAKKFHVPIKNVKKIFGLNFEKYHYKIRKNSLIYNKVIKVEDISIKVGDDTLTKKIHTQDNIYYITKAMSKKYGVPCIGSYFSTMHIMDIHNYKVAYTYVISFYYENEFYTILRLSTDLDKINSRFREDLRSDAKKLADKYQFKNISMEDIIQAIHSIVK